MQGKESGSLFINEKGVVKIKTCLKKLALLVSLLILVTAQFCSCHRQEEQPEGLYILCTAFPQYDFVRNIVGDKATVELLIPPGSEIHAFGAKDISMSGLERMNKADLLIYTGGETDEDLIKELQGILTNQDLRYLSLLSLISCPLTEQTLPGMMEKEAPFSDPSSEEEEPDEHIWTSPVRVLEVISGLTDAICQKDRDNTGYYQENAKKYKDELTALDAQLRAVTENPAVDTLIFADRFPFRYLCHDYGLKADAAFQGCSAETEPDTATLDLLYRTAKELGIRVIFYVDGSKPDCAGSLAERLNGQALQLHSVHNISLKEYQQESYLSLMQKNIEALRIALGR